MGPKFFASKYTTQLCLLLQLVIVISLAGIKCQQPTQEPQPTNPERQLRQSGLPSTPPLDSELIDGTSSAEGVGAQSEGSSLEDFRLGNLMMKSTKLFQKDTIDPLALSQMDCHLRNVDYCYAGIMGAMQKVLPETDTELETRCDEIKAATTCLGVYNQRCALFKVFAALTPFSDLQRTLPPEIASQPLPPLAESLALNRNASSFQNGEAPLKISMADLTSICEPDSKQTEANRILRARIFQMAKCINQRLPALRPCIEDLKTAIQVVYEPTRSLPLQPSCCAIARFQHCSSEALDGICGLNSFDQLERSFTQGPNSMLRTIGRVCRSGYKYNSPYCIDALPPSGMKAPQRRGRKASKLSKALDMFSFSPAVSGD